MVLKVIMQRVHSENDIVKLNIPGFDTQMRGSVYMGLLFTSPYAAVWFCRIL